MKLRGQRCSDLYVNTALIVLSLCSGSVCAASVCMESVHMSPRFVCIFVCVQNVFFVLHPSRKSVKRSHRYSSREKWGDFELECMEGGEWGLEGEVAICCDEKKMGTLALFYCSDCRRIPPR